MLSKLSKFFKNKRTTRPEAVEAEAVNADVAPTVIFVDSKAVFLVNDNENGIEPIENPTYETTKEKTHNSRILEMITTGISTVVKYTSMLLERPALVVYGIIQQGSALILNKIFEKCCGKEQVENFYKLVRGETISEFPIFIENIIKNFSNFVVNHKRIYNFAINQLTPIIINAVDDNIKKIFLKVGDLKTVKLDEKTAMSLIVYFETLNYSAQDFIAAGKEFLGPDGETFTEMRLSPLIKSNLVNILQLLIEVFTILNVIDVQELEGGLSEINKMNCLDEKNNAILNDDKFKENLHTLTECFREQSKNTKHTFDIVIKLLERILERAKTQFVDNGKLYKWDENIKLFTNFQVFNPNTGYHQNENKAFEGSGSMVGMTARESEKGFSLIAFVLVLLYNIILSLKAAEQLSLQLKTTTDTTPKKIVTGGMHQRIIGNRRHATAASTRKKKQTKARKRILSKKQNFKIKYSRKKYFKR